MNRARAYDPLKTRVTLLARLADLNDSVSWRQFFDTYWQLIYDSARRAGLSETDAEDVVQETLATVARQIPTFKYDPTKGAFKAWLLQVTRSRIMDHYRALPTRICPTLSDDMPENDFVATIPDPASLLPDAVWDHQWEVAIVEAALANIRGQMDPKTYQVFDLYVTKEWSAKKVAERFQISAGAVYMAKHRVTEMLKAEVERLEKNAI